MKQKVLFIIFITLSFIILSNGISQAITITAVPNPATVNQNVSVNITATLKVSPFCTIEANFGDGSSWVNVGTCTTTDCKLSTNHIYTNPGIYTITARSRAGACATLPANPRPPHYLNHHS
ncbi:MAG: hypothetical protein L0922_04725, partial [Candidatus Mariimomonas ferrooxydans]